MFDKDIIQDYESTIEEHHQYNSISANNMMSKIPIMSYFSFFKKKQKISKNESNTENDVFYDNVTGKRKYKIEIKNDQK